MTSSNTVAYTYNTFVIQLGTMAVVNLQTVAGVVAGSGDANFDILTPQAIQYAELRIQRDLDLLPSLTSRTYALNAGSSTLTLSANDFVVVQDVLVNINGTQTPLLEVDKTFLQNVYPPSSTPAPPAYFALTGGDLATGGNTSNYIMVGPPPDNNYPVSVLGTIRLPSLAQYNTAPSAGSATTWISTNLPDLMLQAAGVYLAEYQRNFGEASSDPQMGLTYELQYQGLLASARSEQWRSKGEASGWTPLAASPAATPSR